MSKAYHPSPFLLSMTFESEETRACYCLDCRRKPEQLRDSVPTHASKVEIRFRTEAELTRELRSPRFPRIGSPPYASSRDVVVALSAPVIRDQEWHYLVKTREAAPEYCI
jgi:hypothetical protein